MARKGMAEQANERHEQARDLTEQALEQYAKGNSEAADRLVEQAKRIDPFGGRGSGAGTRGRRGPARRELSAPLTREKRRPAP